MQLKDVSDKTQAPLRNGRSRATIAVREPLDAASAVDLLNRVEMMMGAGVPTVECELSSGAMSWCTVAALLKAAHLARLKGGTLLVHTDDPVMRSELQAKGLAPLLRAG